MNHFSFNRVTHNFSLTFKSFFIMEKYFTNSAFKAFVFTCLLMVGMTSQVMAVTKTASVSGNWSSTATWGGAAVPATGDDIIIANGVTLTMDVNATCFSVSTTAANPSAATIAGTGTLTTGGITINASNAKVSTLTITCIVTCSSVVTGAGNGSSTYNLTVNGTLKMSASPPTNGTIVFTCGASSTVEYNGTAAQAVFATTYQNLILSGALAKTTTGATVNGKLSLQGSATTTGTVATYGSAATLEYKGSTGQTTGIEFPATFAGSGGVIIDNASGVTLAANKAISGGLTITMGTLATSTFTLSVTGATSNSGTLTINSTGTNVFTGGITNNANSTLNIGNATGITAVNLTATATGNTVNYTGTTPAILATSYYNLNVGTGATSSGSLTVSNVLSGTSMSNTGTLTLSGASPTITTLTATANPNTVIYSGASQTVKPIAYHHLSFSGTGTPNIGGAVSVAGTTDIGSNVVLIVSSGVTLTTTGAITNAGIVSNQGTIANTAAFTNNGTYKSAVGATGVMTGSLTNNSNVSPGGSIGCLNFGGNYTTSGTTTIEATGSTVCTGYDNITVTGTATLSGTLDLTLYTPVANTSLIILSAGMISGTFSPPTLPTGWGISYTGTTVTLSFTVLSAEMTQFKVNTEGSKTKLNWQTASEQNTSHFDVERSQNGLTFDKIGQVSALGKGSDYNYVDATPFQGVNYYRLKTNDLDGKTELSKTISVTFNGQSGKVKMYPNPVGTEGVLNIETAGDIQGITINNALGQVVLTSKVPKINISQLPSGLYNVTIKVNGETLTEKFLKN
jgi:Secretion system C-terminal sorting domain